MSVRMICIDDQKALPDLSAKISRVDWERAPCDDGEHQTNGVVEEKVVEVIDLYRERNYRSYPAKGASLPGSRKLIQR